MADTHFLSYSSADGAQFARRIYDTLNVDSAPFRLWMDKKEIRPGEDWDEQIVEAIRNCVSLVFLITRDSVEAQSVCKQEWARALKYKKPIVPVLCDPEAEVPFQLGNREYIDLATDIDSGLTRLSEHLAWLRSPEGICRTLDYRLADARRDLRRAADDARRIRIEEDIQVLERQIVEQRRVVDDPVQVAVRVEESIQRGLERDRRPKKPVVGTSSSTRFINPSPGTAPSWFQDRVVETRFIADFLKDDSLRMLSVVARGGMGKTAIVCRLLKALEAGRLPDDPDEKLSVDGIVYLSAAGSRGINLPNLYADLCKLLDDDVAERLNEVYRNTAIGVDSKIESLMAEFPRGRNVVLLDNFEDVVDLDERVLRDPELKLALKALLNLPQHSVKVIITTRVAPMDLALAQPARQTRLDLDEGLPSPFAENILREMDRDGKVGLKMASEELLRTAKQRTLGNPRALEALFAILSADRDTTLEEILRDTEKLLPENVVEALVGEAYSRLGSETQKVMQALAIYARPVSPAAIDYLLQPHLQGVDSASALGRLVNMHFVRREAGRYYLHPVDREYALSRIPPGIESDRDETETPPFSRYALWHRGAEYFKMTGKPREEWRTIADLESQLAEFELRFVGGDFDVAADLLNFATGSLYLWGHDSLLVEMYEKLNQKVRDPSTRWLCLSNLAMSYIKLGRELEAIPLLGQSIDGARELNESGFESTRIGALGSCYSMIGQTDKAIEYGEEALQIAIQIGDPVYEAHRRGNLGVLYFYVGQLDKALEYQSRALEIAREAENRSLEGINLNNIAAIYWNQEDYGQAESFYQAACKICDEISEVQFQNESRLGLARTSLMTGDLESARAAAESAMKYRNARNDFNVQSQLGLIMLLQGDDCPAANAFSEAAHHVELMLKHNAMNYKAHDALGLALCGMTLCGVCNRIDEAVAAYRAARKINSDVSYVRRVVRLLESLRPVDPEGVLGEPLAAAKGRVHGNLNE